MLDSAVFKKIKRLEIVSKHLVDNVLSGNYLSTFQGQGLEFSEVREYVPGDEVRTIDWNVTARMEKPYVKVFQEERELTLVLAVDVSASTAFGSKGSRKRDLAAQVAAALGFAASMNGDRVGMMLFSSQLEKTLPPRKGRKHVLRGVRDLLVHEPAARGTDFGPALLRLKSFARSHATVILISDFQVPGLSRAAKAASRRNDLIACRLMDPAEHALPAGLGLLPARDPETGKGFWLDSDSWLVRRRWKRQAEERLRAQEADLRRGKIDWFDVSTDADIVPPLVSFFRRREKRRARG
jgi:uncharacterized protein (DUF58 family)